jgi:hypothetical protein
MNEEFRSLSTEEELLLKMYDFINISEDGTGEYYSSTDVMIDIGTDKPQLISKMSSRIMGKALSKWVPSSENRKMANGITKYYLKRKYETGTDNKAPELKEENITDVSQLAAKDEEGKDYDVPF